LAQVEYREGFAEALPAPAESVDLVISNGVINLCPDKAAVFREAYRVLKPGGRLQIADIVVHKEIPAAARDDIAVWTAWIGGALLEGEYVATIEAAGFVGVQVGWRGGPLGGGGGPSKGDKIDTHRGDSPPHRPRAGAREPTADDQSRPSWSRAASDIRLWSHGGSNVTSTRTSVTPGTARALRSTSSGNDCAAGQPAAVSVMRTATAPAGLTSTP